MSEGKKYPLVPLSEVLVQDKEYITELEPRLYPKLSVKLYGKGVVLDEPTDGASVRMKRHQLAKPGQVILSEIWAKKGAIGIVPEEGASALVTSHFFLFDIDESKLLRPYMGWLLTADYFEPMLSGKARGTTGYAAVRPKQFLECKIPLPSPDEQRRIVAHIEELAALTEEARELRVKAREEAVALQKSMLQRVFSEKFGSPDDWPTLSRIVGRIENGWSPACLPFPADEGEWGVLKVGAVSTGQFVPSENKTLPPDLEPRPEFEIRHNDFLFSRANTKELVGACTIVRNPPKRLLLCDKIFRFIFKPDAQVDKLYLNFALKSPPLREQIEAAASGTSSSMKNISKAKVMRLRVPLPTINQQCRIVAYLDRLQAQVDELIATQDATQAELEALLPSVLDQAFRGEL
jgi:type I restriction enzyme S subunit